VDSQLILKRYRPLETLGEGGHGSVTLAFDTRMARRVAVKRVPLRGRSDTALEEARTAAMLNHPNIVTVHEWDTDEQDAFIIMEHIDGTSLAEILEGFGALDLDVAAVVLGGIIAALSFAHENGVLHLDVKPENVLVTRDGRVKVTDFGIASLTGSDRRGKALAGTLGFMPLEQIHDEHLDERTDEWALAALAFEVLANANPLAADSLEAAAFKAEYAEIPDLSAFDPGLDPAIDDIVLAALDPDPDGRYEDVTEFGERLLAHLGDAGAGALELAEIVEVMTDEEEPYEYGLGLWDRLAPYSGMYRRLGASIVSMWLTYAGLAPFELDGWPRIGVTALVGVTGLVAPGLGAALGLACLCAGVLYLDLVTGLVTGALAIAFWLSVGRHGRGETWLSLAAPVLGIGPFGLTPTLIAGYAFTPVRAAIAGGLAAASIMATSAASGVGPPFLDVVPVVLASPLSEGSSVGMEALLSIGPLLAIVTSALAAWVVSLAAGRGSRPFAALGMLVGLGMSTAGAWATIAVNGSITESTVLLNHVAGSLILMVVVIAVGPPTHSEE